MIQKKLSTGKLIFLKKIKKSAKKAGISPGRKKTGYPQRECFIHRRMCEKNGEKGRFPEVRNSRGTKRELLSTGIRGA
jgi:hypothetical protein